MKHNAPRQKTLCRHLDDWLSWLFMQIQTMPLSWSVSRPRDYEQTTRCVRGSISMLRVVMRNSGEARQSFILNNTKHCLPLMTVYVIAGEEGMIIDVIWNSESNPNCLIRSARCCAIIAAMLMYPAWHRSWNNVSSQDSKSRQREKDEIFLSQQSQYRNLLPRTFLSDAAGVGGY